MKLLDAVLARPVGQISPDQETSKKKSALELGAIEYCALFKTPKAAINLIDDGPTVGVALDRFLKAGHLAEARRLLAFSMDRRDSIWWAYLCALEAARHKEITTEQKKGLDLVLAWGLDPNDARRKKCKEAFKSCRPTSFVGSLCFATWLSGGSISPYAKRHIEPNPSACGKLCGVSVYLASVYFAPARWKTNLRHFIDTGILVAKGECPIPQPNGAEIV